MYSSESVSKLVDKYYQKGGEIVTIQEGSLLDYGLAICFGDKLKTCVINEVYLNEWSSAYKIRFYNKCPKKYDKMIENFYNSL